MRDGNPDPKTVWESGGAYGKFVSETVTVPKRGIKFRFWMWVANWFGWRRVDLEYLALKFQQVSDWAYRKAWE